MVRTRRSVLQVAGCSLLGTLAGCASSPADSDTSASPTAEGTATQTATATATSSPTPSDGAGLTFSGEVLRQESGERPARLEAVLSNDGESTTEVGYGPALLFTDNSDVDHEWPETLVLDPEGYIGPWDDPFRTEDGCWRFPADGTRLVQSGLD